MLLFFTIARDAYRVNPKSREIGPKFAKNVEKRRGVLQAGSVTLSVTGQCFHPRGGAKNGRARGRAREDGGFYRLLLFLQMCISSAFLTSSSRKSGWAMLMSASARSQVDRPLRFTMPYSVTMY